MSAVYRCRLRLGGCAAALALLLAGCSPQHDDPLAGEQAIVWPPAPSQPRIAFVKAFSRPSDLGVSKGLFERLFEMLAGPEDVRLVRPVAVAAAGDGSVYVGDPGVRGVHVFDTRRRAHRIVRRAGEQELSSPVGLALGPDGRVYVSDSSLGAVFAIAADAEEAQPLPLAAELQQPTGLAFDAAGQRLYVVDTAAHVVRMFALDGTSLGAFGERGSAAGQFNYPTMIWRARDGRLLVSDSLNFRVQIFDADGRHLGQFGQLGDGTGSHSRPKGIASDRHGHIYVVDGLFHAVQIFDDSGAFLLHVGGQGHAPGEFWLPTGIFVDDAETIYVADSHNQRVQVFRYVGAQP